jgi:hypothetical protein
MFIENVILLVLIYAMVLQNNLRLAQQMQPSVTNLPLE